MNKHDYSKQALYLNTLKVIINQGRFKIYNKLCEFLKFFYKEAFSKNEAISLVVAECIGKLAAVKLGDHALEIAKRM
jgi:hypothetical protein